MVDTTSKRDKNETKQIEINKEMGTVNFFFLLY